MTKTTLSLRGARVRTDAARVPSLWWFEVRNTLIVSERRGRLTESDTATFLHAPPLRRSWRGDLEI